MKKTYRVEIAELKGDSFYYPSKLGSLGHMKKIWYGHRSISASVKENPSGEQTAIISKSLAESLSFHENKLPLHLFIYKDSIHIGPLVGIFTSGITSILHKPVGERSGFFSRLLSLNKATSCIPFLFGEHQIDWESETIRGYVYRGNHWEVRDFPFPNVIYDRLPNRKTENSTGPKEVKRKFQEEYEIPWYNPGFFNKWDIHERLTEDEDAIPYLPETYPFQSLSAIETLLSKFRQVYIKPIHGSLGLGIHQILYDKNEHIYYCRYKDEKKINKLTKFPSLEAMFHHIFRKKKLHNLIIQQGIPLIRTNKRPIDFRVHTNKNHNGEWQVTAIAAKIAGEGSVTTHVKSGGSVKTLDELFEDKNLALIMQQKLSTAALTLSNSIEKTMDGVIAEIGFDLGVDKQGRVWMFEANSKPGRSIFSHPKLREFEILTRQLCLEYAAFLTEQSIHSSGGKN
ncbi:YheC/YheD family protein [Bacillus sp. CECT 9360]|uniref:YheC/YheD family endospore coat-associated protein n=1 Tax=Bacillus sp. CECT 9360 TaxID=2845821 RepID=UPI001E2AB5C7|nr:YheC/YheD family protein [Bacillus sp. CECT 9360]CAH0344357.1 Endospore coat-associated protein YheD [Bacillus sp. CECT 9360]